MATKKTKSKKARTKLAPRLAPRPGRAPGARPSPETLRLRGLSPSFTATDLQRQHRLLSHVLDSSSATNGAENGEHRV